MIGTRVLAVVVLAGCLGPRNFTLLPRGIQNTARDPDPTRPLVETPATAPPSEQRRPRTTSAGPGGAALDIAVGGAAIASWLLGAAAPLVGVHGMFDENRLFEDPKQPTAPRTEQ